MRGILLVASLSLLLAGCSDNAVSDGTSDPVDGPVQKVRDLPAAFSAAGTVTGAADPMNFVFGGPCETPGHQCQEYPFTVNASRLPDNATADQLQPEGDGNATAEPAANVTDAPPVRVEAVLSWGLPASDFDLYLMQDGVDISGSMGASDATATGATSEAITLDLLEGDYVLVVVPWAVAQDSYTLDVAFA